MTVDAAVDGDALRIAVWDTGPGIAPESLARLRHVRAGSTRPGRRGRAASASGLIVHGLVAPMGGRIAVESVVGDGSVFRVAPARRQRGTDGIAPATAARTGGAA